MSTSLSFFKPVKTDLPPNLLGWETGTVEILAPIKIEVDAAHIELIEDMKKLTISTSDSTEVLPTKEATVEGGQATWEVDSMRLPVYSRCVASSFPFLRRVEQSVADR